MQGTLNGPPPEFLQSLVQMAGQIMNRITTTATTSDTNTTTTSSTGLSDSSQSNSTSSSAQQAAGGQNSQARGNTQTNPTTATHTRSTPRPHVHLAQQAMQGGFDPFLPCNSHHVTHRRRAQQTNASQTTRQQQQSRQQQGQEDGEQRERVPSQNLPSLLDEIYSTMWAAYRRRRDANVAGGSSRGQGVQEGASNEAGASTRQASGSEAESGSANSGQITSNLANLIPNIQSTLVRILYNYEYSIYMVCFKI